MTLDDSQFSLIQFTTTLFENKLERATVEPSSARQVRQVELTDIYQSA